MGRVVAMMMSNDCSGAKNRRAAQQHFFMNLLSSSLLSLSLSSSSLSWNGSCLLYELNAHSMCRSIFSFAHTHTLSQRLPLDIPCAHIQFDALAKNASYRRHFKPMIMIIIMPAGTTCHHPTTAIYLWQSHFSCQCYNMIRWWWIL